VNPIAEEKVYPCVYLGREELAAISLPQQTRRCVLIRDLRDTLVSGYFSIKNSHVIINPLLAKYRMTLERLSLEKGLVYLMEVWLPSSAHIQRSWLESGEVCLKLEQFMEEPTNSLHRMFVSHWGLAVSEDMIKALVKRNSFSKLSQGRKPGQEDVHSHYRKGTAGDWKRHFTSDVTRRFKRMYNDLILKAGYEKREDW
jgi:lipopolysaccharide transport system ATP-binding protein